MTRCRTTVRGDLEIEACLEDGTVNYTAMRGRDEVAIATAEVRDSYYVVTGIQVAEKAQRARVGTRMYEQLAADACAIGLPLASDELRSHFAEAFWRKQEARGRVVCRPGKGEVYVGPIASLKRRLADGRISQEAFDARTRGLPRDENGTWPCATYELRAPCVHATLDGTRRRSRRARRAR